MTKTLLLFFILLSGSAKAALINGFESGDIGNWTVTWVGAGGSPGYGFVSAGGSPIEGSNYGNITSSGSTDQYPILTLNAVPSLAGSSVISLYYNTTFSCANNVALAWVFRDVASNTRVFNFLPSPMTPATDPARWTSALVSAPYLSNLGLDLTAVSSIAVSPTAAWILDTGPIGCSGDIVMSYDHLAVDLNPVTSTAIAPTVALSINYAVSCNRVPFSVPAQAGISEGYHVYRAPYAGAAPPATGWTSVVYVANSGSYIDNAVTPGSTYWYLALPYHRVAPKVTGTGTARFLKAQQDLASGLSGNDGPHEGLITTYAAAFAVSITVGTAGPLTGPSSLTGTACDVPQAAISWNPATITGCNPGINFYVVDQATNISFVTPSSLTLSGGTTGFTFTNATSPPVAASTTYYYRVTAYDNLGRVAACFGPANISLVTTGSNCTPPTPTPVQSATPTPAPTNTPVPGAVQIYPNPFRPDKGECFKVGNVSADAKLTIYDMNGDLVYSTTLVNGNIQGATCSGWDGFNNNGARVVTGIYYLVVVEASGTSIHRVAVIRD